MPQQSNPGTVASPVGIFGGTFDPDHYGHLRAALEVREFLGLDELLMLPAGMPPHRDKPHAPAEHRLAMLHLATAGHPDLRVDNREVRREGRSYMVDTLSEIREERPAAPLLLVIGQDAANQFDSWRRWETLLDLAHLVVMRRPESRIAWSGKLAASMEARLAERPEQLKQQTAGLVLPVELTQLAISSTDIRHRLKTGLSPGFLLPDSVIDYIRNNGLYFAGEAGKG
jgi:nicotinate-nucleotide adenylyltransferase